MRLKACARRGGFFLIVLIASVAPGLRAQQPESMSDSATADLRHAFDAREQMPAEMLRRTMIHLQEESGLSPNDLLNEWRERHSIGDDPAPAYDTKTKKSGLGTNSPIQYDWQNLGPFNQAGRVRAAAIIPSGGLVIAADGGGIWKMSRDSVWKPITDTFPSLRMNCLAVAPSNPAIMVMGTGEGFVYFSSDSGSTWSVTAKSPGANILSLAFHIKDSKRLYAATDNGLFLSRNDGVSWTSISGSNRARSIVMHPTDTNVMYYGRMAWEWPNSTTDIMKSTNGGKTFTPILTQGNGYWSDVLFGLCHDFPNVLWAGFDSSLSYYRSTNAGGTWTKCAAKPFEDNYNKGFSIMVPDPHNASVAFAGGPGMYRTTDIGATWIRCDKGVHADQHALTFGSGKTAMLGCDGGGYITDDYLAAAPVWHYITNGVSTLEAYNVAGSPDGQDIVITGNQDNGYAKYTGDDHNWKIVGGDGFATIYDKNDPLTFFHEYTDMNLHRASDGFTWWSTKTMKGLPTTTDFYTGITGEPVDWYGQAITADPNTSGKLYVGTDSLFVTTDNGDNWALASNDLLTGGGALTAIAVQPGNGSRIITGSNDGKVCVTSDGGASWYHVPQTQFLSQASRIESIAFDSNGANVYAVMQVGPGSKGVFRSTNSGTSWSAITNGLPSLTPTRILVDDLDPSTLYLGTTIGLFTSSDRGASWLPLFNFPNVYVQDLAWHRLLTPSQTRERTLLVGTYGRGIIRGRVAHRFSTSDSIVFPNTRVGRTLSQTSSGLIFNSSSGDVTISELATSDTANFGIAGPSTFTLGSSTSSPVTFNFTPRRRGPIAATLTYKVNGSLQPPIPLRGYGRVVSLSLLRSIDFGTRDIGTSADSVIPVNVGGDATTSDSVLIQSATLIGPDAAQFSMTSLDGYNITTSSLVRQRIGFAPQTQGKVNAALVIGSDASERTDTIMLSGRSSTAGVEDQTTAEFTVGPNPASSTLNITGLKGSETSLAIFDESGRQVLSTTARSAESVRIDVSAIPDGLYDLVATQTGYTTSRKFQVRH